MKRREERREAKEGKEGRPERRERREAGMRSQKFYRKDEVTDLEVPLLVLAAEPGLCVGTIAVDLRGLGHGRHLLAEVCD